MCCTCNGKGHLLDLAALKRICNDIHHFWTSKIKSLRLFQSLVQSLLQASTQILGAPTPLFAAKHIDFFSELLWHEIHCKQIYAIIYFPLNICSGPNPDTFTTWVTFALFLLSWTSPQYRLYEDVICQQSTSVFSYSLNYCSKELP